MTVQITILGLGRIGASAGLALAAHKDQVSVTGHDKSPVVAQAARKMGAVEHVTYNLPASVEKADIVLLSMPMDQVEPTLQIIAQDLREDAVVLDFSAVKVVSGKLAKLLPAKRHYVGLTPATNPRYMEETTRGVDSAHADLFGDSLVAVSALSGTAEDAIKLAADFVTLLGAQPWFAGMEEMDGIMAGARLLPQVAALAMMENSLAQPGWDDMRKIAGGAFHASASGLAAEDPAALGAALAHNPQNILRLLDEYIHRLGDLRARIAADAGKALESDIQSRMTAFDKWKEDRRKNDWSMKNKSGAHLPTSAEMFKQQLVGGLGKLLRRREPGDKA